MSENTLKNCPFCGGEAELGHHGYSHDMISVYGRCKKCDAHGKSFMYCFWSPEQDEAEKKAIEAWNTRKPVNAVLGELKQYQAQYESGLGGFTDELVDRVLRNAVAIVKRGLT